MAQMIDIAEVEAAMEEFRIDQRKKAEEPGFQGVVYRAQLAVLAELTIWRAKETNRGTDPNEILNAIVGLAATAVAGEIMSVEDDPNKQFGVLNRALRAIGEEIASLLLKPSGDGVVNQKFEFIEGGTA